MPGLFRLTEPGDDAERVTLDARDCALFAWPAQQLADRARASGAPAATVARLEQAAELIARLAQRVSANVGHDVGTDGGRLADGSLVGVKEVSKLLNVSERTARRRCRAAGAIVVAGQLRIAREAVEAMR